MTVHGRGAARLPISEDRLRAVPYVKIRLNGDPFEVAGPLTVSHLLARLDIDARRVAVEHNLVVLKRGSFDTIEIREGDQVEIVNFVGGGSCRSLVFGRESFVSRSSLALGWIWTTWSSPEKRSPPG